ncbi:DUF4197 domain-containing protein [Flavobacterium sp. SUN046]|uniref:DUF4197 domain-containing protein n=1 Tax=Flavobacterium sp. SUN046 TaxID=3002440 RepID=UPI002DBD57E7|nr:DUF4197 domain-containing protein [Flavobacterium sp. SUN046]MEC4049066.1 DUF4197 domain-containing protein [Flavobacterium sp. SUN046]
MKNIFILLALAPFISFAQVKKPKVKLPKAATKVINTTTAALPNTTPALDISAGLKEALNNGISKQVAKLTLEDGFFQNQAVKILMPEELQNVEAKLRKFGMGHLADQGILAMNRAAEDAVKEATPIFVTAVKNMSITDAKSILLGNENAATTYLQGATNKELYAKFSPVVQQSIGKVGADVVWSSLITKYNEIPFVNKVNPDITDYVTNKAMEGVFKMIAVEEKSIRTDLKSRTSSLLQQVFALQDKK